MCLYVSKYLEILDWLYVQIPNFQRQGTTAYKPYLTNIQKICERLGNPQKNFRSIHIAGTNGKGSTAHILAAILQSAGEKTGLYTSPHLIDFRERIKINGQCIPPQKVIDFITEHRSFFDEINASFFEITVAMAFDFFAVERVSIAVIEVGMGGRLDATNIINPLVAIITNIGLDHTEFLGDTLRKIAFEKAGIIKPNTPVIIGAYHEETFPVFSGVAQKNNAPLYKAFEQKKTYPTDLKGAYQKYNIKTARTAIKVLKKQGYKISKEALKKGLLSVEDKTGICGRWQQISDTPKIICDTAHNKEGFLEILPQLKNQNTKVLHMVIGFVADKNINAILSILPPKAVYYFCAPPIKRALPVKILKKKALDTGLRGNAYNSVFEGFIAAKNTAAKNDLIFIGGSNFVVAEILAKEKKH